MFLNSKGVFIIEKTVDLPVKIFPIGAITVNQEGLEITEIGEMIKAGAIAISDDGLPVQNGQVLRYALEYTQKYGVPVINHAEDIHLRNDGVMNESTLSTRLGLPGNPDISESVMVHRDLEIADYCGGRIHVPHVSTKRSVDLIREYKKKGVDVSAEVTPHHLGLTEEKLTEYNTHSKVAPPLRTHSDREALIEGLMDGTIDCIATDHAPHTIEEKEMDFINAPCGMIGLESAFGLSHTTLIKAGATTEQVIQWFTSGPAKVMGWELASFQIGQPAELVVIDPKSKWKFKNTDIQSRSKNSPMIGMEFIGKVEERTKKLAENYGLGVKINRVYIRQGDVELPFMIRNAYKEKSSSLKNANEIKQQAENSRRQVIESIKSDGSSTNKTGEVAVILSKAKGQATTTIREVEALRQRFYSIYGGDNESEPIRSPAERRRGIHRLYFEVFERLMTESDLKIYVISNRSGPRQKVHLLMNPKPPAELKSPFDNLGGQQGQGPPPKPPGQ